MANFGFFCLNNCSAIHNLFGYLTYLYIPPKSISRGGDVFPLRQALMFQSKFSLIISALTFPNCKNDFYNICCYILHQEPFANNSSRTKEIKKDKMSQSSASQNPCKLHL